MGQEECGNDPQDLNDFPQIVAVADLCFHHFLVFDAGGILNGNAHQGKVQNCHQGTANGTGDDGNAEGANFKKSQQPEYADLNQGAQGASQGDAFDFPTGSRL